MPTSDPIAKAVAGRDERALRRALAGRTGAVPPRAVVEAGRLGWRVGLELLAARGADLNACYRHYRALHALIQEKPHEGGSSTPARVACLEWLLAHGADPDELGAWPSARAVVVAAATGERSYVRAFGSRYRTPDVFVASALGRAGRVAACLSTDDTLATARDHDVLTALHCASLSRLGRADARTARGLVEVATLLLDAGADPNATARCWGQDVAVSYFAIRSRQDRLLTLLLDRGMDATGGIPAAAWDHQFEVVDRLVSRGGRLDDAISGGRPLLNDLIRWGQFGSVRALLARGASPDIADGKGWTAMHQAASRGNAAIWRHLVEAGGDCRRVDKAGDKPDDVSAFRQRERAHCRGANGRSSRPV